MNNDDQLRAILGPSDRPADRIFVAHVYQEILLEDRYRAARTDAWRCFARDAAASCALVMAGVLLARNAASISAAALGPAMSPATLMLSLFILWAVTGLRPGSQSEA